MPARVEPVKDIMSISGWEDMATPTSGPVPFTRLKTPAGTPASCITSAKISALIGAISVGFRTMVHPAAMAGPTLAAIWFRGQFQGVIKPQTPMGSRTILLPATICSKENSFRAFRVYMRCPSPAGACAALASPTGAPISWDTAAAISPMRAL